MSTSPTEHRTDEVLDNVRHLRVTLKDVKVRASGVAGADWVNLEGHAAVFNTPTELYSCQYFAINETIAPGAFSDVLATNPDVHLNINHDMTKPMARTGVEGMGALELTQDASGLRVHAQLDPSVSYVADLVKLMKSGVVDQMSFAFIPGNQTILTTTDPETGFETDSITLNSVAELFDVCVCPQGAYPTTDASVRNLVEVRKARSTNVERTNAGEPNGVELDIAGLVDTEAVATPNEDLGGNANVELDAGIELERIAAQKLDVRKRLVKVNRSHKGE
jgi:uncharacterized protein